MCCSRPELLHVIYVITLLYMYAAQILDLCTEDSQLKESLLTTAVTCSQRQMQYVT